MNRSHGLRWLAIFGFAATALATIAPAAACGSRDGGSECGLNTCDNGARFQRNLQVTSAEIPSLSISFCRNGVCNVLTPVLQKDATYACTSMPSGAGCLLTQDQDTGWSLTLSTTTSISDPKNGDLWTVTVTQGTSGTAKTQILSVSESVDYSPQMLNGDNCGIACETALIK